MANPDAAFGFRPYSAPFSKGQPVTTEHELNSSNSAIYIGSPVSLVAGGIDLATAGTGNALKGISAEYKAASADGKIRIYSDPQQRFVAQTDDGTGTATAEGAIGLNINFIGTGGSGLISTAELDESSATVTNTLQFHIEALAKTFHKSGQNAFGEFNQLVVRINDHQSVSDTGVTGV